MPVGKKQKRVISKAGREAISRAQKARWDRKRANKIQDKIISVVHPRLDYIDIVKYIRDRASLSGSVLEAYIDGFIDGFNEAKK